jgi:hypothetical protein
MYRQWNPQVRRGFFHIGDRPFYMFADKVTRSLDDAAWLAYDLDDVPCAIHDATIGGLPLPESSIVLEDSTLYVRSLSMSGVLDLEYGVLVATGADIEQEPISVSLDPTGGRLEHYLDPKPTPIYPVLFKDPSGYPVEFDVDMSTGKVQWLGTPTNTGYIPPSGTFEYEGSDDIGPHLDVDLNTANVQRQAGILNLMSTPSRDIESELF